MFNTRNKDSNPPVLERLGEIDIGSHALKVFGADDRIFLEECAAVFGQLLEKRDKLARNLSTVRHSPPRQRCLSLSSRELAIFQKENLSAPCRMRGAAALMV